jgi:hypothetical protein
VTNLHALSIHNHHYRNFSETASLLLPQFQHQNISIAKMAVTTMPLGPYKLVTVNTAPERAKRLIGRVVEAVKEKYTIIHAVNVESTSQSIPIPSSCPPKWTFYSN